MPTPTGSGPVSAITLSGNAVIDSLRGGTKWGGRRGTGATVSYSIPWLDAVWSTSITRGYGSPHGNAEPWNDFIPLAVSDVRGVTGALRAWASVAAIRFEFVIESPFDVGDLRFGYSGAVDIDALAHAYLPRYGAAFGGDVWFNSREYTGHFLSLAAGTSAFETALHEIGHALGLKHPFDGSPRLPVGTDHYKFTVMSYNVAPNVPDNGTLSIYPTTPMPYDIDAVQYFYGPNTTYRSGNDTYVFDANARYFRTLWDTGGRDTLVHSGATGAVIDLRPSHWSTFGRPLSYSDDFSTVLDPYTVVIYRKTTIENATGGIGNDRLDGNETANRLLGGAGDDVLNGRGGADVLVGGSGNDRLDGGSGIDRFNGGAGDDRYTLGSAVEAITDPSGIDTVRIGVAYTLPAGIENLVLLGTRALAATGNELANVLHGNDAVNKLDGRAGADRLVGGGGSDVLTGGAGADVFLFDQAPGEGVDRILDFVSGTDLVYLLQSAFPELPADGLQPLAATFFAAGDTAVEGDDFLVFDATTGLLGYDGDASGPGAPVPFASIAPLMIDAADIYVVV